MQETTAQTAMTSRRTHDGRVAIQKSRSVAKVADPRVEKSRAAISTAFAEMLARRSYDRIRVSDITRKAAVSRATFYAHFAAKDDLLRSELERVMSLLLVNAPGESSFVDCTKLFAHIHNARDMFRSLTSGSAHVVTERLIQDAMEKRLTVLIAARGKALSMAPTFAPRFGASTLLALITWSLEQPSVFAPDQLQGIFRSLVGGAFG
jgi:AcrR family transcriptional regulator